MQIQSEKQFLSIKEIAKILDVNAITVWRLVKSRKLPATKFGGQWRVRKEAIENYK